MQSSESNDSRPAVDNSATPPDWLAVIRVAGGAGSWFRSGNRDEAVRRCVATFRSDFGKVFKLAKGMPVKVNVLDVKGHDVVEWGDSWFNVDGKPFEGELIVVEAKL